MASKYQDLEDRLLSNCLVEDNGFEIAGQPSECWLWLGKTDHKGYGCMNLWINGKHQMQRAHRVSFEFFMGTRLREGQTLDHGCRVRRCIHPNHLTPVTRAENTRLMRHYWAKRSAEEAGQMELSDA